MARLHGHTDCMLIQLHLVKMEVGEKVKEDILQEDVQMALDEAVFYYLTKQTYPDKCRKEEKRTIRKKSNMFVVRDGVMFFKKKKNGGVNCLFKILIRH